MSLVEKYNFLWGAGTPSEPYLCDWVGESMTRAKACGDLRASGGSSRACSGSRTQADFCERDDLPSVAARRTAVVSVNRAPKNVEPIDTGERKSAAVNETLYKLGTPSKYIILSGITLAL